MLSNRTVLQHGRPRSRGSVPHSVHCFIRACGSSPTSVILVLGSFVVTKPGSASDLIMSLHYEHIMGSLTTGSTRSRASVLAQKVWEAGHSMSMLLFVPDFLTS